MVISVVNKKPKPFVTVCAVRRRGNDGDNDERRDDGQWRDGRNWVDVVACVTYPRSRCSDRLAHLRAEEITAIR